MNYNTLINQRFRGFLPIIIDVETGGTNPETDALLEIAVLSTNCDDEGQLYIAEELHYHVEPHPDTLIKPESLEINKIQPHSALRYALPEPQVMAEIADKLQTIIKAAKCKRCILVGHNAWFDLAFVMAAARRSKHKKLPLHSFSSLDTATLGALYYGHTVLAKVLARAGIEFSNNLHHSALYDARVTGELFCKIVNEQGWPQLSQ